jgi:triacylglycerol lipase
MDQVDSIQALEHPGDAEDFFKVHDLGSFNTNARTKYDRNNALWLMEFSRLIYRQENDEVTRPDKYPTRNSFLKQVGWEEETFFNKGDTQAGWFVSEKPQCAVLVFRGTLGIKDIVTDLEFELERQRGEGEVHEGFLDALEKVWDDVARKIKECQTPVFFTGHSLGAALATLAVARCLKDPAIDRKKLALYTFGSPRVGNADFGRVFGDFFHCRVVNEVDMVPTLPPEANDGILPPYRHVGQLHWIEADNQLHVYPQGFDAGEYRAPGSALGHFWKSVKHFFARLLHLQISLPELLRDHTPVNYTARLEKAGLAGPDQPL